MGNIQLFQYNDTPMEFEVIDGQVFANATIMCQAFNKRPSKWLELESTKRYLDALQVKTDLGTSLVETRKGNSNDFSQGTWIHEKLILKLAQWLDVNFEIWCDEKIAELLRTGKAELDKPKELSRKEILLLALEAEERAEKAEKLLLEQKPKVEFYDQVADGTGSFDLREVSGLLKLKYGRNTLFKKLRDLQILQGDNMPYRNFLDSGHFIVVESSWTNPKTQEVNLTRQTRITQKGIVYLQERIEKFKL